MIDLTPKPVNIAKMAKRTAVKEPHLTHFRVHMESDDNHARAKPDLSENFSGKAGIVEQLDEITV